MMIQDINHIEVAQEEVVGATGNIYTGFYTFNGFKTDITQKVNLGGASSASAGASADAVSLYGLKYTKADTLAFVTDLQSSSKSVSAAAIQYH